MDNTKYRVKLFTDGDEIAWVEVYPSQKDRFETLVRKLAMYASRFGCNVQYQTETIKED